jgi:Zn-dependent peptidase ImmA (M78 family)
MTPEEQLEAEAFERLFETAQGHFHEFIRTLRLYNLDPDPNMRLHRSRGMNSYYYLADGQIYLALPGLRSGSAKFYLLYLKQMLGIESNTEFLEILEILLPRLVAHEIGHSLRHRYKQFQRDNMWLEEQAANQLAMALIKRRLSPAQKRKIGGFLSAAIARMGRKIESREIAIDSYRDVVHALNVTQQIGDTMLANIELIRQVFAINTDDLLRASGQLPEQVVERMEQRQEVIEDLNQEYTKDSARYLYYHSGWMYFDLLSKQTDYVDEFGVTRLGVKRKLLPEIEASKVWDRIEIQALFRAYQGIQDKTSLGARFFFKRYRTALLNRLEDTDLKVPGGKVDADLSELMEIWTDGRADPLELLEPVCPPEIQRLFPKALLADPEFMALAPEKLLPTETDRRLWLHFAGRAADEETANTAERLGTLDDIPMLRPLSAELQLSLAHRMYVLLLDSGEPVLWQSERNTDIFILVDGLLEILVDGPGGFGAHHIGTVKPGALFGEYSFITGEPVSATVRAVRPSKCYVFKGDDLKPITFRHPAVLVQIAASLAEKLNRTNTLVATQDGDMTMVMPQAARGPL